MDLQLKDKVIFVAGGSRGIGLGIVEACLREGARLAIAARGEDGLEEVRERLAAEFGEERIWAHAGDMRETELIEAALEATETEFGPIWGAVGNVGTQPCPPGFEIDDETWDAGFTENLDSAFRLSRAALRRMTARGEGSMLFISSIAGVDALGAPLTYGVAKAAVDHLSRELSKLAGESGVRVNTIAAGNVIFPGSDWETRSTGPHADDWWRWVKREVPLQRFGTPEDIGAAAAFLLSPVAGFVTGLLMPVDGGQTR